MKERVYKYNEIQSFKPSKKITGYGPQCEHAYDLPLGEMIRMSRLNDLAIKFGEAKQAANTAGLPLPNIKDKMWSDLKYHPRYKRQFKGGR
jgi:hypothetical protein